MKKFLVVLFSTVSFVSISGQKIEYSKLSSFVFSNSGKMVEDSLLALLNRFPNAPELNYLTGLFYRKNYKYKSAEEYFRIASDKEPGNIKYLLAIANCYLSLGIRERAAETFDKIILIDTANVSALASAAKIKLEKGKYRQALRLYDRLINIDSSNYYFLKNQAFCFYRIGKFSESLEKYLAAFRANNLDISVISMISTLYSKLENPDSSFAYLMRGLQIEPRNTKLNKAAAEIKFASKEFVPAVKYYLNAIVNGDSSAATFQKLGLSYYYIGSSGILKSDDVIKLKYQSAVDALLIANKIERENPLTFLYLGLSYKELKDYKNAILYLDQALKFSIPDYVGNIYIHLGIIYQNEKEFPEAIASYKKALKYDNENYDIYYYLASVYDAWYKDKSVALLYFKKYLESRQQNVLMKKYAQERIEKLKEFIHFRKCNN